MCDIGYCKSEFVKKVNRGKCFFISRHMVICLAREKLTYKVTSDQDSSDVSGIYIY